jgi:small basic protein
MWWLISIIGLALGIFCGQFLRIEIPAEMIKYLSIAILAALDSVFGGMRSIYEKRFDSLMMLSGFFTNALLAAALAYIGDMLGMDIYYAAVFVFGVRLFNNLSAIRHHIIDNLREKERVYQAHHRREEDSLPLPAAEDDGPAIKDTGSKRNERSLENSGQ